MMSYGNKSKEGLLPRYLLAIESSCDETAAAVLSHGELIKSNIVSSQVEIHREYGGIVPEIASRKHLEAISLVVSEAVERAGIGLTDIDAVAITQGPGLVGSLVVGLSFAKAFAVARGIPFTGVNHLAAHLASIFLEPDTPSFPFIGMVVSGGHTSIYRVDSMLSMELLGRTRDDAAGEAFDKVAKILGLEYPGGPVISHLAAKGDPAAFDFPRAMLPDTPLDFSFSGLKTSVLTMVRRLERDQSSLPIEDLCASFQEAVVDVLIKKLILAARNNDISEVVVTGGVAANSRLRQRLSSEASREGIKAFFPSPGYCTDNAAMVAVAGFHQLKAGIKAKVDADVYSRQFS